VWVVNIPWFNGRQGDRHGGEAKVDGNRVAWSGGDRVQTGAKKGGGIKENGLVKTFSPWFLESRFKINRGDDVGRGGDEKKEDRTVLGTWL